MTEDPLDKTGVIPDDEFVGDPSWSEGMQEICARLAQTEVDHAADSRSSYSPVRAIPFLGKRYQPIRLLGQGGMGAVYLTADTETGGLVAAKVLPPESLPNEETIQRFQKESRLLAEVQHPHVANLLDVGRCGEVSYLIMELVEGTDLKAVVQKKGALPERLALQIISDVAAALAAAHDAGIVHRDLKPGNILLSAPPQTGASPTESVFAAIDAELLPNVKLTDFGLARHVDQAASLDLTKTSAMLGTPYYISPEQCTDKAKVTPASDVYSLGATLFELLTGRPPFTGDDPVRLITRHCFEQAPDPRKLNPLISDGAAALVLRALQKAPAARFADAGHMRADLDRLVRGEANNIALHPVVPEAKGKVFAAEWEWDFDGQPADLWPLVSNTERINAAVGLPPVEYVNHRDEQGVLHRIGSFRLGFTHLQWEEHPFEWVEGRRLGVLREFKNGPFQWFVSVVEVTPRPTGGSRLTHSVRIAPRGWLGRMIAYIEVHLKGRKPLDRVYRRINEMVTGRLRGSAATDPYESAPKISRTLHKKLDTVRARLAEDMSDTTSLDHLLEFLAESPAQELARIRPRALATRFQANPDSFTIACLAACHAGLLEMHWDVICPTCRVAAEVKQTLSEIDRHARCEACNHDFETDFSSSVEMIFRVHPEIRQADIRTYCIGGPEHAPHVVAQTRLNPGEALELDLTLDPGSYILRGTQLPYTISISAETAFGVNHPRVRLNTDLPNRRPICVRAGRQLLTLVNDYPHALVIRLERAAAASDAVTAADAMRLPEFRKLFPAEVITRDRLSNLATSTLLGLRITNVLDLFASLGDIATCDRVHDTFQSCLRILQSHGGKLVKESDDRILVAFSTANSALTAALEIRQDIPTAADAEAPQLQMALHRGMTMSTSFNGRSDVFGRSVTFANHLLDANDSHELVISQELFDDEDCQNLCTENGFELRPISDNQTTIAYALGGFVTKS
ncbi:protein kinase [Blastopirellula sp. J2-11]|uniref:protein kinase domain-containing protein n=1 Tax=Blastopirellula sp. J2-11 TaxID=2943192 RepID=UPI0021C9FFC4|nr:protein kinase [Blastopirellula sp. J2-11]UUO08860.1 protein kinase [Blastopirellula sp. J2-11]